MVTVLLAGLMLSPAIRAAQTASSPQQDAWEIYRATKSHAWDEYRVVAKQAWHLYRAQKDKAWDSYRTLAKQAWNVYRVETAKAWKDYGPAEAYYAEKRPSPVSSLRSNLVSLLSFWCSRLLSLADYYRKEKEAKETYYLKQKQAKQAYYRSQQKGAEQLRPQNSTEEVVKQILVELALGGSEVYGLAEIVAEALDSGPVFLAESWNKKFFLADAMSAPFIEPTWAQQNGAKMIALDIELKRLQRQLEGNTKNVSPENFPKYQELIDRVREL